MSDVWDGYDAWLQRGLEPTPEQAWIECAYERTMDNDELRQELLDEFREDHPDATDEDEDFTDFVWQRIEQQARAED